jgi:hypothetical protein
MAKVEIFTSDEILRAESVIASLSVFPPIGMVSPFVWAHSCGCATHSYRNGRTVRRYCAEHGKKEGNP